MFVISFGGKADREAYYYLQKANVKNSTKARNTVLAGRVLFIVLGLILLRTAVNLLRLCLTYGFTDRAAVASLIVSAALSLSSFACAAFYFRRIAGRAVRTADRQSAGTGELRFEEERFCSKDEKNEGSLPYSGILSIYRHGNYYYLFVSKNQAVIADASRLTEGDPQGFAAFLKEKTGKEIVDF